MPNINHWFDVINRSSFKLMKLKSILKEEKQITLPVQVSPFGKTLIVSASTLPHMLSTDFFSIQKYRSASVERFPIKITYIGLNVLERSTARLSQFTYPVKIACWNFTYAIPQHY